MGSKTWASGFLKMKTVENTYLFCMKTTEILCYNMMSSPRVLLSNNTFFNKCCGIIRICGGLFFVVFMGSPPQQIYILNERKFRKSFLSY